MAGPPDEHRKGARTLSETLGHLARVQPNRVYASIPTSSTLTSGFRDVTVQQISYAVDACAWWLSDLLGNSDNFETLAYVGVSDLGYTIFFHAAIKCGYKAFFVSSRLTTTATLTLLEQTACTKFFHSSELASKALELQSQNRALTVTPFVPLDDWLALYTKPFPYEKTFEDAKWDPAIVLHSSGTTGPPKPIILPFGYFTHVDTPLPPVPGREAPGFAIFDFETTGRFYSPSPPYHLSGVLALCVYPVYGKNATLVLGPPDRPPTGELIAQIMDHVNLNLLWSLPMFIEQVAKIPGGMEKLQSLDHLCYTGGPLARWIGDALTQTVTISSFYGSTEAGGAALLLPLREDWEYLDIHPCYGAVMEPVVDRLCELVLPEKEAAAAYRGNVWTFPDRKDWRTGDIFEEHATKPGLWRYYARCDDIITLPSGQKFNPVPLETALVGHPKITGAVFVGCGDGRDSAALLLEPADPVSSSAKAFVENIWLLVEDANARAPVQARIELSRIAVTEPGGLVRASKGTVVRKLTIERCRNVIEDLYTVKEKKKTG